MPLGTGNDLSLSFGWGNVFMEKWISAPQVRLQRQCALAATRNTARWDRACVGLVNAASAAFLSTCLPSRHRRLASTLPDPALAALTCPALQLYATLKRIADAQPRHLDCWDVSITAPDASFFPELPYALAPTPDKVGRLPACLHTCTHACTHACLHACLRAGLAAAGPAALLQAPSKLR